MPMSNEEMLEAVKIAIKELSDYNDNEIRIWISTATSMLNNAGLDDDTIYSPQCIGIITQMVNNLRLRMNILEDGTYLYMLTTLLLAQSRRKNNG